MNYQTVNQAASPAASLPPRHWLQVRLLKDNDNFSKILRVSREII